MKKWFDKKFIQSPLSQLYVLILALFTILILGGILCVILINSKRENYSDSFLYSVFLDLLHFFNKGVLNSALENNPELLTQGISFLLILVILIALVCWFAKTIFISLFAGVIANFLNQRRAKILNGEIDYQFTEKYILIVGYDFQVKNLIKKLLDENKCVDIVILTDLKVKHIYEDISSVVLQSEIERVFVIRKDIAMPESYINFYISGVCELYLIGDEGVAARDSKVLQAAKMITQKQLQEHCCIKNKIVKVYLHINDFSLYTQIRTSEISLDSISMFDVEVFNYYESWAWECWSKKSDDSKNNYLPLLHRINTTRVELFVIGAGQMGRAFVNYAMPIMNYGNKTKQNRITIFDSNPLKSSFLPDNETLDGLPETEVLYRPISGNSEEANKIMLSALESENTSVSIVIAHPEPSISLKIYSELSIKLRRSEASILIWQATSTINCLDKRYLFIEGGTSSDDMLSVMYFGMTDILPWKNRDRYWYGLVINYFYNTWFSSENIGVNSLSVLDKQFKNNVVSFWNCESSKLSPDIMLGVKEWLSIPRWKKWSSINSGDALKEKSALFNSSDFQEVVIKALEAEHNRWWTEKLLSGWISDSKVNHNMGSHANITQRVHKDMIPFDELSDEVKDKDKINIAAMIICGFIK